MLHNQVSDDPRFERRFAGSGPLLSPLEWDVHAYLAINGALHDDAIAAWTTKAKYDSIRPMSMIRYLANLGQSSDPELPNYHASGLPLTPGLIELVTDETAAEGKKHAHLSEYIGEIALNTWQGVPDNPETEASGVGWIRGADWTPYHLRTFPTPNFAGYVSGHSTFARAGAEVMSLLTGSPYFPGGLKEFHFAQGEILQVEYGPSEDLTIQCATYYDAADLTGVARLYCGVHIAADDFVGREMGARAGIDAFLKTASLRNSNAEIHSLDTPTVEYTHTSGIPGPISEFTYAGTDLDPLPILWAVNRKTATSSPTNAIYTVSNTNPENPGSTDIQILVNGYPVREIETRGPLDEANPLSIRFNVATPEPVFLLVTGAPSEEAAVTLSAYAIDDTDTASLITSNENWLAGERASVARIFTERDPSLDALEENTTALPLTVSEGEYRIDLEMTGDPIDAKLQIQVVQ